MNRVPTTTFPEHRSTVVTMVDEAERSAIRKAGGDARRAVVGVERVQSEAAFMAHLASVHVLRAPSVGVFVAHDGEPDLTPFVELLWRRGQTVALPVLDDDPDDRTMQFSTWGQGTPLVAGRYGIAVPDPSASRPSLPDCLLVSLTAFDSDGNRMGRGAGFFDRYLETAGCEIVGIGFEAQRVDQIPVEPHDVPMPIMVTELGVRYLRR